MAKIRCRKCGKEGNCTCRPVGDGSVTVMFTFFCENCNNLERKGENVNSSDKVYCPFCGLSSEEHEETSQWEMKACE